MEVPNVELVMKRSRTHDADEINEENWQQGKLNALVEVNGNFLSVGLFFFLHWVRTILIAKLMF